MFAFVDVVVVVCVCIMLHSGLKGDSDGPIIFGHQSTWQQDMLSLYGAEMIFIDSTYNTVVH